MAKEKPHSFDGHLTKHRHMYNYCSRCGLIALRNEATRKAINRPCPGRDEEPRHE